MQSKQSQAKPAIVASINPLQNIILAITKDKSNNVLLIDSQKSEHDYSLKKSDIAALTKADLIFYISADLESKIYAAIKANHKEGQAFEVIKIPNLKLLASRANAKKIDPHIWMNPKNALIIAEFIGEKVAQIDPQNAAQYRKNLASFKKEVQLTEKLIKLELKKINASQYIFFHDGYQYFEDYFAVKPAKIIVSEHDSDLTISDAKQIDALVKSGVVKCVIGEKWDEKNTAQKIAKNYQINFSNFDVSEVQGGYLKMLEDVTRVMVQCGVK